MALERVYPLGVADVGDYNHMPRPFREIDDYEFWRGFSPSAATDIEFRQVLDLEAMARNLYIMWGPAGALAVAPPHRWGIDSNGRPHHTEPPRFFAIGCAHRRTTGRQLGRCWREDTCLDCGYRWETDSSD